MSSKLSRALFTGYFASLSSAKRIAYLAVFVALGVVVNSFVEISAPSTKITFTYFVCFFAGFLFGPLPGFLVGFLGDAIGFLLVPQDVYWLFGLTLGVYAFLMGVVMNFQVRADENKAAPYVRTAVALVLGYVLITVLLNSLVNYWYVMLFVWNGAAKKTFLVYLGGRLAFQSIVYAVNAAICVAIVPVLVQIDRRLKRRKRAKHTDAVSGGQ